MFVVPDETTQLLTSLVGSRKKSKIKWTNKPPVNPGWYWYEDDYYGPAPVNVCWIGFIDNPNARTLEVDVATGDEADQPNGSPVTDLQGKWAGPIEEPS